MINISLYCFFWLTFTKLKDNSHYFHSYQQEVFEARYSKIPQEESCPAPQQRTDKAKDRVLNLSTSASSETESSTDAESSSEEVATQLANLKERVGIGCTCQWPYKFLRRLPLQCILPYFFIDDWLLSWKLSAISWTDLPRYPWWNQRRKTSWKRRRDPKKRILPD